jgi:putative MATE family efflux protein
VTEHALDEPISGLPEPIPEPEPAEGALPEISARALELAALSPGRAALELAWPGIIEQLIRASSQPIAFAMVGRFGAAATAAVGASSQFLFLMFPVWGALSTGTVALIARRTGEGKTSAAVAAARQSLVLATVLGVVSGALFVVFARPLLLLIGADADVVDLAAPYLAVVGGLNVFQTVSIIGLNAMRAAGDTRTPMWVTLAGSIIVVALTYVLVYPGGHGVIGAAWAQVIASVAFAIVTVALLWQGRASLRLAGGDWRIRGDTIRSLMGVSLPSVGETLLFSVGILALGGIVFRFGTDAYAAHQIISSVEALSFLPCVGFSVAASALVGQSLGMHDPKRAMTVGWAATRMAAYWTSAMGLAFVLFPSFFVGLFTSSSSVVSAGTSAMIVVGIAQPAQAFIFTLGGALRGAGDTRYTLALTVFNWFVVRAPLAVILGIVLGWGLVGVWVAILVDYVVRGGLLARRFHSGKWTLRKI